MSVNLLLTAVLVVVAVVFLGLTFVLPSEVGIGAFIASLVMAAITFRLHRKERRGR